MAVTVLSSVSLLTPQFLCALNKEASTFRELRKKPWWQRMFVWKPRSFETVIIQANYGYFFHSIKKEANVKDICGKLINALGTDPMNRPGEDCVWEQETSYLFLNLRTVVVEKNNIVRKITVYLVPILG